MAYLIERVTGELAGMQGEAQFTDGGKRLRVRREEGGYQVDAHDNEGRQLFNRSHRDVRDAAREIIGLPTIEQPAPAGNRRMRMETADARAARERDAELRIASDDLQVRDVAQGTGVAEEQLLHQTRDEELREQRIENLARGRKTQLLNRLQEFGVAPGDTPPWSSQPASDMSYADLKRVHEQLVEAHRQGREVEARRYARRDVILHGRQRIRTIQASLQGILRESKTLPEPLRDSLRKLLTDLDLRRVGRTTTERVDPVQEQSDPLRLLNILERWVDQDDRPVGELLAIDAEKTLADMTLVELEGLHRKIEHVVHQVRQLQEGLKESYRQEATRVAGNVTKELRRQEPVRSTLVRRGLVAIAGERPAFLLERMGGGLRSALYDTLYRDVTQGAQQKRRVVQQVAGRYVADQRAAGMSMTKWQLEEWLRQPVEVPEWAGQMNHTWRRSELMSLLLMWRDPYARRNLIDSRGPAEKAKAPFAGGIVLTDGRGRQGTDVVTLSSAQIMELIGVLKPEDRRFIDAPVRNLFDRLYQRINDVFFRKYGYHLEQSPEYFPVEVSTSHVPGNPEAGGAVDFYRAQEAEGSAEPFQGMVQWRTGALKPMVLRPLNTIINRSIDRAAAYVGLEMPLTAARRLMSRRNVTALMRERWGVDTPNTLNRYLRDVAGSGEIQDGIERVLMSLKRNVSVASLGLSGKVALSQALSLPVYGIHLPARYIIEAIGQMALPKVAREIMQTHTQYDPDFADRSNYGFDPDVESGRMFSGRGLLPPAGRGPVRRAHDVATNLLMWGIRRVDRFTVARGEQAAVLHAQAVFEGQAPMPNDMAGELGMTADQARARSVEDRQQLAYQWANFVTGRTQPSFLPEHMSAFARGRFSRYGASFSGYTNVAFNALRRSLRVAREGRLRDPEANRAAMLAVMSILVLGPIGVAIMGHVRSVLRGDDEPDPIWKGVVQGQFALHYGTRAPAYFLMSGRYNGGMSNPTMGAIDDLVRSGAQLERSLWSGDEDRIGRATERMIAATLRPIGAPYWTPKGWVDTAINIPELLD